jgi:hypothetical protein
MILHLKDSIRKLLDLINTFSKVAGYKINTQNSVAFQHTDNGHDEKEARKTNPFKKSLKKYPSYDIF